MPFEVILFDLDGTLTDSRVGITKSVRYALKKYGIDVKSLDELEKFIGPPLVDSFGRYYSFSLEKAKEAVEYYREYYVERGIFENKVYEGISELLEELKNLGKILCVATSKPTIFAEKVLRHYKLSTYFELVVGSNLDGTRSSKKEVIGEVIRKLGVKNLDRVIMVGDRKHDVIGARENGISAIAVCYGYGSCGELKEAEPDYFAETPLELLDILKKV